MTRYLIVKYDQLQRLSIHHLLRNYHGESVDDQHMLVLADFDSSHLDALDIHPDVLVAPSIHSETTLQAHAHGKGKHAHYGALQKLGVMDHHRSTHLSQIAAAKYGAKLALDL